ncbi:alpha/beta fold hydrolase [Roseiterribacter gracilis]|uniref:Alpha/beta hydrolase n=1 Tax=Roseiterribacter gracilis TaxID=2812848 RepID=A0A8S8XI97_9PROT|nr:alpha/beta hydrolase [Rhodospirillales bacterium TMPK1]
MNRRQVLCALVALLFALPAAAAEFKSDRIVVTVEGSGPDVVLIPGLTSSPRVWMSTVQAMPGYRYHLVQLRGFAGLAAEGNAQGLVTAQSAEEIARYISEQKLKAPAVVGHSMGGTMAMMIAERHPADVGKVMVVDMMPFIGALFGPPGTTAESVKPAADQVKASLEASTGDARKARIEQTIAGMMKNESQRAFAIRDGIDSDPGVGARAMHELITTDLRPDLTKIKVPMTVLYVKQPGMPLTDEQLDGFYKASYAPVPQIKLMRIPDSYHFIMQDAPQRFQSELKTFLAS